MINIADGKRGPETADQALTLIMQWGQAFESKRETLPIFYNTYMRLRREGRSFPEAERDAPVFTPPPTIPADTEPQAIHAPPVQLSAGAVPSQQSSQAQQPYIPQQPQTNTMQYASEEEQLESEFQKLREDLKVVQEKLDAIKPLVQASTNYKQNEEMADLYDFLDLCKPRLVTLIEAGMAGELPEDALASSLQVNDELMNTLDSADKVAQDAAGGDLFAAPSHASRDSGQVSTLVSKHRKLIQIHTNTDHCLVAFYTWILTTSY